MKTTLIATAALALLAGPTMAQTAKGMTLSQFQTERGDKLFARFDANKDGKITSDELNAKGGGKGDKPEGDKKPGKDGERGKHRKHDKRDLAQADTDHDGVVTRAEVSAMLAERFKRKDANNDGVLSAEELKAKGGKAKVGV